MAGIAPTSSSSSRPERQAPASLYYDEREANKYTHNSHVIGVQTRLTVRALELLGLPSGSTPRMLLDIGCGSGLSGDVLQEAGHFWVGLDVSRAMLDVAMDRGAEGDLLLADAGDGLSFRPGAFDGAVSISMLQWLCSAEKKGHNPFKRLTKFFESLYVALARGARAVFQFYPESEAQVDLITRSAKLAGFTGGLVVDYPNSTKAKKIFLVLLAGGTADSISALPQGRQGNENDNENDDEAENGTVRYEDQKMIHKRRREQRERLRQQRAQIIKPTFKSREWIQRKKDYQRKRGDKVRSDSKYTGRRRGPKF